MTSWDQRFRAGDYPMDPEPARALQNNIEWFPDGAALDIATGTGRNAVFLAAHGYDVTALDQSREGLTITRDNAARRGCSVALIQADAHEFLYPRNAFDVITISFFRTLDRLADIKASLTPGGILFYQHHLRSSEPIDVGPPTDRYRFAANELLHACLDLTVLYYEETTTVIDGRTGANAFVIARNSRGSKQTYPPAQS